MDGDGAPVGDGENKVEKLVGVAGGPLREVSEQEIKRLRVSTFILRENYKTLRRYVTGELDKSALIVIRESESYSSGIGGFYQHLHNYLASLYSYNEHVREKVREYCSRPSAMHQGCFVPNNRTLYTQKLGFLRGLRIDAQHGEFSSLEAQPIDNPNHPDVGANDTAYQVIFDQEAFETGSTITKTSKYLKSSTPQERKYPLAYIATFQQQYFEDFSEGVMAWFEHGDS